MSDIRYNVSYLVIPFLVEGKNPILTLRRDMESSGISIEQLDLKKGMFCGFIDALFETTFCGVVRQVEAEPELSETRVCLFKTGIGFFSFKYMYLCDDNKFSEQADQLKGNLADIKEGRHRTLNNLAEKLSCITLFPSGDNRNVFVYNVLIYNIGSKTFDYVNADAESSNRIDKLHECYYSSTYISLISNQYYNSLMDRDEDRVLEQNFRDRFEESIWMMYLLLHHEKQAYLIYRRVAVSETNKGKKELRLLKERIIDLLTCFSFKLVSEEADIQKWYSEYRNVLNLSDYEQTFSDLIFQLNNELDKRKENKITFISVIIAILGLLQLKPILEPIVDALISYVVNH